MVKDLTFPFKIALKCSRVCLFITAGKSAEYLIEFLMVRTNYISNKFTIISQNIVNADFHKLHHTSDLELLCDDLKNFIFVSSGEFFT